MFEGVSNFMLRAARNIFDSNSTPSFVLDLPRAKDSSHHQDYYISKLGKTYAEKHFCLPLFLGEG